MKSQRDKLNKKITPIFIGIILVFSVLLIIILNNFRMSQKAEIKFISEKTDFKTNENLEFRFNYQRKANFFTRLVDSFVGIFQGEKDVDIKAIVLDSSGQIITEISPTALSLEENNFSVDLSGFSNQYLPGKYKLKVVIDDNGRIINKEQEFTLGVLAINTNKSIYLPNERAILQMAVLRDDGHTICDAKLRLEIQNPKSETTILSTEEGMIKYSGKCQADNVTDAPDYFTYYKVDAPGIYKMKLTNLNNGHEIEDSFEVRESVPFEIERIGPTRIYPRADYLIKFKIKANQDFKGAITEYLPSDFKISTKPRAYKQEQENGQRIIWPDIDIKAGEIQELEYKFDAPDISPFIHVLGFLGLVDAKSNQVVFEESRYWQIASDAPGTRAKTVTFFVDQYSGTGSAGQNGAASNSFDAFNIELAESGVSIKNAFIIFEAQLNGLGDYGNAAGYELSFDTDTCPSPCTADDWGADDVVDDQSTTVLQYQDTGGGMYVRILFDVSSEAELAAYTGAGGTGNYLSAQLGYWIDAATTDTNYINSTKAKLVITYTYNDTSNSITSTVIYPLESDNNTDQGTRQALLATSCSHDVNCALFNYKMDIAEYSSRSSQWFEVGTSAIATTDLKMAINVQGTNASSSNFIWETAQGSGQGNWAGGWWNTYSDWESGFSENTQQQLEFYHDSGGNATMIGGEIYETYLASVSASPKTKTVSFPIGIVSGGTTISKQSASTRVYFPETGVTIKRAWFRIIVNTQDNASGYTLTVSSKVGTNSETSSLVYSLGNTSASVIVDSAYIMHVIASGAYAGGSDYDELDNATADSYKEVILYTTASNAAIRGVSAELMITYTYTSEANGYLTSLQLFGGQSTSAGGGSGSISATLNTDNSVFPETSGNKTIRNVALRASFSISSSGGGVGAGPVYLDSNLAISSPTCSASYDGDSDSQDDFNEFYKNVTNATSGMNVIDNQSYQACYSLDPNDSDTGAKMNGILIYTYQFGTSSTETIRLKGGLRLKGGIRLN